MSERRTDLTTSKGNPSGPYLRDARIRMGMTQREAAERIGVSTRTLQRYEHEGIQGTTGTLKVFAVCSAYGISANLLAELTLR